ncbi:hypothetical protein GCK32_013628 [Trichostrongylus colubriformis]|uniref:Uncharacterized protein n=1 Tax=Trichostrongylus colubriformis TaxID=6319 RepID=A0AAN8FKX5_TRICO
MRRNNLWVQKGQSLIAKACRCRCGLGITKMDKLAADDRLKREKAEARREAAAAAGLPASSLKKKRKSKNSLPTLNFGIVKAAPKPLAEEREARALSRSQGAKLRDASTSSISSTPTSYLAFESRRESFTYASDVWGLLPSFQSGAAPRSDMSGHFADHDDTITTSSRNDFVRECSSANELIPAPLPHRQAMSYASAMKHRGTSLKDETSSQQFVDSPLFVQTDTGSDSGVELEIGSTTGSDSEVATKVNFGHLFIFASSCMVPSTMPVCWYHRMLLKGDYKLSQRLYGDNYNIITIK